MLIDCCTKARTHAIPLQTVVIASHETIPTIKPPTTQCTQQQTSRLENTHAARLPQASPNASLRPEKLEVSVVWLAMLRLLFTWPMRKSAWLARFSGFFWTSAVA